MFKLRDKVVPKDNQEVENYFMFSDKKQPKYFVVNTIGTFQSRCWMNLNMPDGKNFSTFYCEGWELYKKPHKIVEIQGEKYV